jgi:hypothetical protein
MIISIILFNNLLLQILYDFLAKTIPVQFIKDYLTPNYLN